MTDLAEVTENQTNEGWHVDKRVSISHLLTTAVLAVGLVQWGAAIDGRVQRLEERQRIEQEAQVKVDAAQDAARASAVSSVAARLDRIEDKLDRLIERDRHSEAPRSPPR